MMIDKYEISKELEYLLASYSFRNKPQIQRLLTYLVGHAFDEGESAYDQRAIAVECLGRDSEFDPAENPVVRIEIGRLRKLLNHFYSEESSRSLLISIPLGQYRPVVANQENQSNEKFVPELVASPAKPESLSLLLQFETNGKESADLYLLRHQIRIGLTVNIGRLQGVRLVVALPDEEGNVSSHVDFIVRVSIGLDSNNYQLCYSVLTKVSDTVLIKEKLELASDYTTQALNQLINSWEDDLLDREVGLLWSEWVNIRSQREPTHSARVVALVAYQRYLLDDKRASLELAFNAIRDVQREDPEDNVINTALAELYYRAIINGVDVVDSPVNQGLRHVRKSLRYNSVCTKLHLALSFMMFFSNEHQMAAVELKLCREGYLGTYSFKFHSLVLTCLMSGIEDGLDELKLLCEQAGAYSQLYVVMHYLRSILMKNYELAGAWRKDLDCEKAQPMLSACISHMVLPSSWVFEGGREQLKSDVMRDLERPTDG